MAAGEAELVARAIAGDRAAFGELARRAAPAVHGLVRRMGAQPALADDMVQDALVAAYRALATYRGEAPFTAWLMKIAARLFLKRKREDARLVLLAEPADLDTRGSEAPEVFSQDLDRALASLSAAERMCVSLCHGAGFTHAEISEALQVPLGTVKSHVTRGLAKLRRFLRPDDEREVACRG
jgi:RNA polymerase sigma-70 factor (ECF subfamily)